MRDEEVVRVIKVKDEEKTLIKELLESSKSSIGINLACAISSSSEIEIRTPFEHSKV